MIDPANQQESHNQWVSAKTLAEITNMHPLTIRRMGYRGLIPEIRIGERTVRYPLAESLNILRFGTPVGTSIL